MTAERPDRLLSNHFMRVFLQAIEDEMGTYSLWMMLRQAGLERYIETLLPFNDETDSRASEYAALQRSMRVYFGQGARGSLNRIGRTAWSWMVKTASLGQKGSLFLARGLPLQARCKRVLDYLASQMRGKDGQVSLHLLDVVLFFVDVSSDATYGQRAEEPICWGTLGMIQGALAWATGEEFDVEEVSCRSMGAEACRFKILS